MDGLVDSSSGRPRGQQPHCEQSKTFAYFNRRLERPAASSLSSRRFLPRLRRRHGGSSRSRATNCSNSGTLENHFGCGRHGASAAFAAGAAAHFVAYRSAMFAIVFFSSFLLLFATGRSVSLDALLG